MSRKVELLSSWYKIPRQRPEADRVVVRSMSAESVPVTMVLQRVSDQRRNTDGHASGSSDIVDTTSVETRVRDGWKGWLLVTMLEALRGR